MNIERPENYNIWHVIEGKWVNLIRCEGRYFVDGSEVFPPNADVMASADNKTPTKETTL